MPRVRIRRFTAPVDTGVHSRSLPYVRYSHGRLSQPTVTANRSRSRIRPTQMRWVANRSLPPHHLTMLPQDAVAILDVAPRHGNTGPQRTRNGEFIDEMITLEEEVAILDVVPGHRDTDPRGTRNGEFTDDGMIILEEALIDLSSRPQGNLQQLPVEMILAHLKITTYIVATDQESQICTICQKEYEAEESIATTQCGHEYHTDCIRKWLAVKNTCPLCNSAVVPTC
ncbi:hypothetical protein Ancab_021293 [Ancistrocladus abbreviatus]